MGLHPRNRHPGRYDFAQLTSSSPALAPFVVINAYGDPSIDFSNPDAVKALNQALVRHYYGVSHWEIPKGYLCPPIPGRADYIHHVADLLAASNGTAVPRGAGVRVLDIGVGANCIYPIIGRCEYGWSFVGTDIDALALDCAKRTVESSPALAQGIELRKQADSLSILKGIVQAEETFDLAICNPPFHASREEAEAGSIRKQKNLRIEEKSGKKAVLNFGGISSELWCAGGEAGFVRRMIQESAEVPSKVCWFTSLVSKESSLPAIFNALKRAGAMETRIIEMSQGQKKSRMAAWTFLSQQQREKWAKKRWK